MFDLVWCIDCGAGVCQHEQSSLCWLFSSCSRMGFSQLHCYAVPPMCRCHAYMPVCFAYACICICMYLACQLTTCHKSYIANKERNWHWYCFRDNT